MKPIRKEYPPIRGYVKHGQTYFRVDLRRKHHVGPKTKQFKDKQTAIEYAKGIAQQVAKEGLNSIATHGTDARISVWNEQLAIYGKTVEDAIALALKHYAAERAKMETPFIAELVNVWIDDKIMNPLKPLRERSITSIRNHGNNLKKDFGMMRIAELTPVVVEEHIKKKDVSNQTRQNILSYISQFYNWCLHKNYCTGKNPTTKIEIQVDNGTPEFFDVEQCKELMKSVVNVKPVVSYYSLCLFGGIRPEETEKLTWEHIKMNEHTNEIHIPASIAKTKKARMVTMEHTLADWLKVSDKSQPLIPANLRKLKDKARKDLTFDWIQDGLRHTFATFHYAKYRKLEELRHVMGNSPNVIEKFYKGVISKDEVHKFWDITPESIESMQEAKNHD